MKEYEFYYLCEVEQGSWEWHLLRKRRITMSNIGKILGHSPYANYTFPELASYFKKEKEEVHTPEAIVRMNKGNQYEPIVRNYLAKKLGVEIKETGFAIWKPDTRFGASLDGVIDEDTGIEIKCPARMYGPIKQYMKNPDRDPKDIRHIWPSQYDQIIGNGVITGRKKMIFCVYAIEEKEIFIQEVDVDYNYWFDFMYPKACEFYDKYMAVEQ